MRPDTGPPHMRPTITMTKLHAAFFHVWEAALCINYDTDRHQPRRIYPAYIVEEGGCVPLNGRIRRVERRNRGAENGKTPDTRKLLARVTCVAP